MSYFRNHWQTGKMTAEDLPVYACSQLEDYGWDDSPARMRTTLVTGMQWSARW